MKMNAAYLIYFILMIGCRKDVPANNILTYGNSSAINLSTDKAIYKPGEKVSFILNKAVPDDVKVRYRHLDETIGETTLSGTSWTWTAPSADYTGYMVDVYRATDTKDSVYASVAVDVSSDWKRFPRYGFLSDFGQMSTTDMASVMDKLNRYHLNGLQFYDWDYEHHRPLAGTVTSPAETWKDIANRTNYKATVENYIRLAHSYNMKAMSYNLCYGALENAAQDGVLDQWYMYKDQDHNNKVVLNGGSFLKSNIYLLDPGNTQWQNYIGNRNKEMYSVYDFDGYHIDQLGDWGAMYDFNGNTVNVPAGYRSFISAMKNSDTSKKLVMNAVNQFGQKDNIAQSPVEFLYSEVWAPNDGYKDLASFIQNNDLYCNNSKKTVLAAYMDYDIAEHYGTFNTPGILFTDAVIFSFGGAHIELGEHMLGKEYFPNENLSMNDDLKRAMIKYYDFLVAYENLLREGGAFNAVNVTCTNGRMLLNNWPPQIGQVSVVAKEFLNRQVLHFINFNNANSLDWRDAEGTQQTPKTIQSAVISFPSQKKVSKIWMASPDTDNGIAIDLQFIQTTGNVTVTIPSLEYWDMVVIEY